MTHGGPICIWIHPSSWSGSTMSRPVQCSAHPQPYICSFRTLLHTLSPLASSPWPLTPPTQRRPDCGRRLRHHPAVAALQDPLDQVMRGAGEGAAGEGGGPFGTILRWLCSRIPLTRCGAGGTAGKAWREQGAFSHRKMRKAAGGCTSPLLRTPGWPRCYRASSLTFARAFCSLHSEGAADWFQGSGRVWEGGRVTRFTPLTLRSLLASHTL